ncbi:hypothetical protein GTA51_13045 [Desulfovibrio aerotolerans]|uniref:Uncharacterized protein n=1 Tax=Solidesulfovibrio aerotolerans TaxID=295255 RepID=A0A7C9N690_9BACT|nr:hypothetical protein [Solidesulfovibrio aerotolerans]MYL84055.1 hypothetical protein [Solidesulfovibrio aerotolerans]
MSKKTDNTSGDVQEVSEKKKVESKYNPSILRECITTNMDASDIMVKMGITHRQTLKQYVLKLMSDDRTFYEVKGLYLKNSRRPKVNNKFELKLYLKSLDLQGLVITEGDEFSVSVENEMIILTKV